MLAGHGNREGGSHSGNRFGRFFESSDVSSPRDPEILLAGTRSRETGTHVCTRTHMTMLGAALFTEARDWKRMNG